jgi:hypothetical protein
LFTPNLFTDGVTPVTLTWAAPTGITPVGYEIFYFCADAVCPTSPLNPSGNIYTTSTSVTFPPGLLVDGYDYVFDIGAIADAGANFNSSPYRSNYPQAYADVKSELLFITPGTSAAVVRGPAVVARVARQNAIHTNHGSFLVTPRGTKPLNVKARMLARFNQNRSSQASKAGPIVK